MAFYYTDTRRNYYIEFGEGHPMLLLHGLSNSGRAWGQQIDALVDAGCRVIIPDHAGHGSSAPVDRIFGIADIASDTIALLDHLSIDKADVIGLSMGGMLALHLALEHPKRVRRLIVASSFASTATNQFEDMAAGWAKTLRTEDGPTMRFEESWPRLVNDSFRNSAAGRQTYQIWHAIISVADGPSLAYIARGIVGFDVTARLALISQPSLFIAGGDDEMSSPQLSQAMADAVPGARFELLHGGAHLPNVDSAGEFNRIASEFLR